MILRKLLTSLTICRRLGVPQIVACRIWACMSKARAFGFSTERVREALNDIAEVMSRELVMTHGVEIIHSRQDTSTCFKGLEVVSLGDPYYTTVIFDYARGTFRVESWGDIVTREPRRFAEGK